MNIGSPAFSEGDAIPAKFTCKGENINPELRFDDILPQTKSLALIMDDPDASIGNFTHWLIYNMPVETRLITENSQPPGMQAKNDAGENKYFGPCPSIGEHRYFFTLYALDTVLPMENISVKADLVSALQGHILDQAALMGKFKQ